MGEKQDKSPFLIVYNKLVGEKQDKSPFLIVYNKLVGEKTGQVRISLLS